LFLDLKYHDIPNTVAGAVEAAADRDDTFMLTVHASGGRAMIRRAASAAGEDGPSIVAVTALTSLDADDVREITGSGEVGEWAERLGDLAMEAGADGLVCSGQEVDDFRRAWGADPLLVTPGIRPASAAFDDQKRAVTPAEALDGGSDFLVVGRPIYEADDPIEVVERIADDIS
jgi:orotidine-5'-phosphate decarboxylase